MPKTNVYTFLFIQFLIITIAKSYQTFWVRKKKRPEIMKKLSITLCSLKLQRLDFANLQNLPLSHIHMCWDEKVLAG